MSFEQAYKDLVKSKLNEVAQLSAQAEKFIADHDYHDPQRWMEALAVCEASLDTKNLTDTIKKLYLQMYRRSWNTHAAMRLNDEDYKTWMDICSAVNHKFIDAGHYRAYVEESDLIEHARQPHRNFAKSIQLLKKGIELGDGACMATYGYYMYHGIRGIEEANKEEGINWINKSKEANYDLADLYLLYIAFYDPEQKDGFEEKMIAYQNSNPDNKAYYLLADFYMRNDEMDKAAEALKKGIADREVFSKYEWGMNVLNGRIEGADNAEALKLLEEAYDYNNIYAANFLGQYYNHTTDGNESLEKAIEWYKKAIEYYSEYSAYKLALIYLYIADYKNPPLGMEYLNMAIQENHARAMSEKAYLLLESDDFERDIPQAKALLEKATELGDDYAPYRLGRGYQNAEFVEERDFEKAFELYKVAADRGHIWGMELLGRYYRVGYACEPDPAKAIEWYQKAVDRDSDYARVELAYCHEVGFGLQQNYQEAFKLYQDAANNNYVYAYVKMGYYYQNALIGDEDLAKAFECFKKAADEGYSEGQYNVGRYYKYAMGMPENPELALEFFRKAAEGGDMDAHIELALCYEHEYGGLDFDGQKAVEYMTAAAEEGVAYAQYKLGYYLYYGIVDTDMEKGMEWLRKAYENGSPQAALTIGDYYLYGHGEEKEYDKAYEYYKFAEDNGGYISEGIGLCYEYAMGVEENNAEAFKYYTIAADRGYRAAKYRLGLCYQRGTGVTKNLTEAFNWLSQAAEDGNRSAQYEAGMLLLKGEGVALDAERGIKYLLQAAEDDHDDAQLELGNCYLTGNGVAEDDVQAMYWFQKAAENGNEQAQKITGRRQRRR